LLWCIPGFGWFFPAWFVGTPDPKLGEVADGQLTAIFIGGCASILLLIAISVVATVRRNYVVTAAWFVTGVYAVPFAMICLFFKFMPRF
jgi:hypothetical protein